MSSEHDISLVTSQAGSVVAENQHVTLGTASGSITPSTAMAMIGINQNVALAIDANVTAAKDKLTTISANVGGSYSADEVAAATIALGSLNSLQSSLGFGGSPNQAGFGSFLSQAHNHIKDGINLRQSTDFMANSQWSDFGTGITNMATSVERGLTSQIGKFQGAGAAVASTGTMFNNIDIKNFGTPTGLVQALQNNKLANATGVNQKLVDVGVDLNDLDNPVYKDQIANVLGSIKDPTAINVTADQMNITNPFAGLPSYTGDDSSLYNTQNALGGSSARAPTATTIPTAGTSAFGAPTTTGFPTAQGTSTTSTAFGSTNAPTLAAGDAGGIQSLRDLSDYTKLANPSDVAGFSGTDALVSKFKDMGAGSIVSAGAAPDFFSKIQTTTTPKMDTAHPTLTDLIKSNQPSFDSMTGTGNGPKGLPNLFDFAQHVGGGPDVTAFNTSDSDVGSITAFNNSITKATSLWSTAGVDLTAPPPNSLGSSMAFATNLHKYGADKSGTGVAELLGNMANGSTKFGESVKASLAEGNNNKLFQLNGMGPIKTNPFDGLPAAQGENSLENGPKMLGGGGGPPPTPSRGTVSGSSRQGGSFGSEQIQGQEGTGTAGLRGTPFDLSGGR